MTASLKKSLKISVVKAFTALGALVLLSGCELKKAVVQVPPPPPEVSFITLKPEEAVLTTVLPGRVAPFLIAEVRPQVGGIIQKRFFEEGADVKEGDVLYQIDDALYKAAYDKASADLAKAEAAVVSLKKNFERNRRLVETSSISQKDFDDSESNFRTAEAEILSCKAALETTRINLAYTKISAPISGRIGKSQITVGALVTANYVTALATIQKIDPVYVDVTQSNASLLRLKEDVAKGRLNYTGEERTRVKLILENGGDYPQTGSLQFRDITIDQSTGSFILRIVFQNPDRMLLPGMFVQAVLETGVNKQAILIPQQSVSRDAKGQPTTLTVNQEGKIDLRMLELGQAMGDRWLVLGGLAPGDRLLVEGTQKVRPGIAVNAIPFSDTKSSEANSSPSLSAGLK